MQNIFVTGTDTDVGKTVVTAALYRAALLEEIEAAVIKPVQTGVKNGVAPDIQVYNAAVNDLVQKESPKIFEGFFTPCSPHLAALLENRRITVRKLVEQIRIEPNRLTILEGAGGLFVPLNETETMLDLIRESGFPVLLVFENRVGCINHVLLSLRELERQEIPVLGLVSNTLRKQSSDEIETDNIETITKMSGVRVLARLPWISEFDLDAWNRLAVVVKPVFRCFSCSFRFLPETQ